MNIIFNTYKNNFYYTLNFYHRRKVWEPGTLMSAHLTGKVLIKI